MPANLIDDCFYRDPRDGSRMTHAATLASIRDRVTAVVPVEVVPLEEAAGRLLAEPVAAPISVPGHTNSAVDGYAFAFEAYDAVNGAWFDVAARQPAGLQQPGPRDVGADVAVRIFTGAVMPAALDTVAMQEDCEVEGDRVFVPGGLKARANVRRAGEDVVAGDPLLSIGDRIRAPQIAQLASVGIEQVRCFQPPRVGLAATGDEIVRADGTAISLQPGQVFDANTPMLKALLGASVGPVQDLGIWPDNRADVIERLAEASACHDLLITSGGASQGEEDHISHALQALGARHFWQIAVKPGRPLMLGQIGNTVVVGLPGNPVAVFVCYLMYVLPIIRQLSGARWREPRRFRIPADFELKRSKLGRREFWRATTRETDDGLVVTKYPRDGSGLITGLREADGLIDVEEDLPGVRRGQLVDFIPFSEFGMID